MFPVHLLVTRPHGNADVTLNCLMQKGYEVSHAPLLKVSSIGGAQPLGFFDCIVVTSANGAAEFAKRWMGSKDLPIIVTGSGTERVLKEAGFRQCHSVLGGAQDVVAYLAGLKPAFSNILYVRAFDAAHDISAALMPFGISCSDWIVYRTEEANALPVAIEGKLKNGEIDGVLLYSTRTARAFARLINGSLSENVKLFALSEQIAKGLGDPLTQRCVFSDQPSQDALFSLLDSELVL